MKKYIFSFCTECSHTRCLEHLRHVPVGHYQLWVRYPKLAILLFVVFMYLQVKASSLDLQIPTRGRVAPKLACVQDIRPHVPELGCTSAVQNEKYIFSFCTAESGSLRHTAWLHVPTDRLPITNLGFDTPSWQYYSWYSCICKSRHRALTCKYLARTRRPQVSLRSRH